MRCPDCNKFVSYEEPEAELNSVDLNDSSLHASVRVILKCAECSQELKDAEIETDTDIEHDCKKKLAVEHKEKSGDPLFEIESDGEPQGTDRTQTTDRHGRQIRNSRYMRRYYGFTLETEVKCLCCEEKFIVTLEGEEQASGFNELV